MTSIATTIIIMAIPMLMTTSKPQPAEHRSGMKQGEGAPLYRLMTWLSPSFPVGAFSYSSGIEWAVEAGDIVDAASLRDWLAAVLAPGSRILRRRVSCPCAARGVLARRCRTARHRGACGRLRALARTPA